MYSHMDHLESAITILLRSTRSAWSPRGDSFMQQIRFLICLEPMLVSTYLWTSSLQRHSKIWPGFWHVSTEMWIRNDTYIQQCESSGEDPNCADSLYFWDYDYGLSDHRHYLGEYTRDACSCWSNPKIVNIRKIVHKPRIIYFVYFFCPSLDLREQTNGRIWSRAEDPRLGWVEQNVQDT